MYEVVVLLIGAGLGIRAHVRRVRPWSPKIGVTSPVVGLLAATVSGELAKSWGFVFFDTFQAWTAAIGTWVLVSARRAFAR